MPNARDSPTRWLPRREASRSLVIAAIRGRVIARGTDHVVVETSGVGYKVFVPRPPGRDDVLLHTHQVVREDDEALYGFETRPQKGAPQPKNASPRPCVPPDGRLWQGGDESAGGLAGERTICDHCGGRRAVEGA